MVNMLVKCEAKSNRVKGMAFHPTMPWLLSALHNGTIQMWDYQLGTLVDKFEDHEGPVRGISFHSSQPLFVSGGDDYKVKVWNYKLKRCLFTLVGHLDYIRTTVFHHEYPWILSASDDQTIRIWNWQSRQCIAVLTGHNHYVMCANFHPRDDLVISASLDQTVRVWDVSGLKAKTVSSSKGPSSSVSNADLFGVNDAVVKFVLEGHDRGVNWAEFHPTQPLIVSASDDRTVKLWRMNESKAWEIDTLRGHFNNVSSATFHPKQDLIVTNSEDKTIRIWDATRRQLLHTFKRESDRFWVLACHKNSNLIAAGHDNGMVVFKLDRERPLAAAAPGAANSSSAGFVYVVRNRMLTAVNSNDPTAAPIVIGALRKQLSAMATGFRSLVVNPYNSTEMNVLITYDYEDGGCYDLFTGSNQSVLRPSEEPSVVAKQGAGNAVAFVARNRFVVLSKDGQSLNVFSTHNEFSKKVDLPFTADRVYAAGSTNRVVLRSEDKAVLLDVGSKQILAELSLASPFRQVVWSADGLHAAFLLKHAVVVTDTDLRFVQSVAETIRVKSGVWDEQNVFVYTTTSHLKYALPFAEEHGLIQSIPKTSYLIRVAGGSAVLIDRECAVSRTKLFVHEYMFKLSLLQGNSEQVLAHLKSGRLLGSVTIGYLKKKGFPEVALQFVRDVETRFNLSLEFGHINEAYEAAKELKKPAVWSRLHTAALELGNVDVAEKACIAAHDITGLQFLYLLTGNEAKLGKLASKLSQSPDHMARFNLGLLRGDASDRAAVLAELGMDTLAAATRKNGSSLTEKMLKPVSGGSTGNWPMTTSMEELFAAQWAGLEAAARAAAAQPVLPTAEEAEEVQEEPTVHTPVDAAAWGDSDLDAELEAVQLPVTHQVQQAGSAANQELPLAYGESREKQLLQRRRQVVDLVIAGEFSEALSVLHKRVGLVNAAPLQPLFMDVLMAAHANAPGLPFAPSVQVPLVDASGSPSTLFGLAFLEKRLAETLHHTGAGNSGEALHEARYLLHALTLALAGTKDEEAALAALLVNAQKYAVAMLIETTRRELSTDPAQKARELELAAYLCCAKIEPTHLLLVTGSAMNVAFRAKNFILASHLAKRIITGAWGAGDLVASTTLRARKVLAASEDKGTDEHKIAFDPAWLTSDMKLCSGSLTPIHPNLHDQMIACPMCKSGFHPDWLNKLCSICNLSAVGTSALGIQFLPV